MFKIIISLTLLLSLTNAVVYKNTSLIWQGFDYTWGDMTFFEVPHRIGSIKSLLTQVKSTTDNDISARLDYEFTPGVNGGYSHPVTYFQGVRWNDENSQFSIVDQMSKFTFTDKIITDVNEANSTIIKTLNVPENTNFSDFEPILDGFNIQMKCIDKDGNSNGIWPFKFQLSVIKKNDQNQLELTLIINRGWTPSHGGGKKLNQEMKYDVEIPYKIVYFNKNSDYFTTQKLSLDKTDGTISDKTPLTQKLTTNNQSQTWMASNGQAFVGLTKFGFELVWGTNKNDNRGRYINTFQSMISQVERIENQIKYQSQCGLLAPGFSTYQEQVTYEQDSIVFMFNDQNNQAEIGPDRSQKGDVCLSDWTIGFSCLFVNMKQQNTGSVDFNYKFQK